MTRPAEDEGLLFVFLAAGLVLLVARHLHASRPLFLLVLGAAALLSVGLLALLRALLGEPRPKRSPGGPGRSGWARRGELTGLLVSSAPPGRLVLGRLGRCLVAAERCQSLLVVGPSQSGKTTSLALPALLEWDGPVLATSVKGDLVKGSLAARSAVGETALFDPTGSSGLTAAGWSPLEAASSWAGARRLAADFASIGRLEGGMEDAGYWYAAAERLLAPLLRAVFLAGGRMPEVLALLEAEETELPLSLLSRAGEEAAARSARAVFSLEERQRSSIYSTAHSLLAAYGDPAVAASELNTARVDAGWLFQAPRRTLYLAAPIREQARLRPVFVALVRQVLDAAYELAAGRGRLASPLLVLLDEAANIAPLDDLDQLVATSVGHDITFLTIWQDLAQIEARYGARWATIVNNHRAKVVYPGLSDPRSLELVSSLLGETGAERKGRRGRLADETELRVPVAPVGWLRRLPAGRCLLVYGTRRPALLQLRRLGRRSEAQPAMASLRSWVGTRRAMLTAWSPRRS
jgi:type IV secretion system protein VirD4